MLVPSVLVHVANQISNMFSSCATEDPFSMDEVWIEQENRWCILLVSYSVFKVVIVFLEST